MGRIFEKRLRLRRRNSNDIIYPETLASLVKTKDGKTVEDVMAGIAENIPEGYSLVGAVASGNSTELDFVDKGAYILGVGTYTIGESSEEVEEGYIGIALMTTMANDTDTVSLIQIAVGAGGGGAGFYAVPIVIKVVAEDDDTSYFYQITGEIDTDALASCVGISIVFDASAMNMDITYRMGLTRHMVITTSEGAEESYEFGCGALGGEMPKTIGLALFDGELAAVQVDNFTIDPWEDPLQQVEPNLPIEG